METYYLVYAFDKECERALVLKEGTLEELDNFTSKFNNSNEIRDEFEKDIRFYREDKKDFIKKIENKTGKRETGDIVIHSIECGKNREKINKRIRVMYKYHISLLDELIENKKLMKVFSKKCYKERTITNLNQKVHTLSEYETSKISFPETTNKTTYSNVLNKWKKSLKKSDKYFATMRELFNIYKELCKKDDSFIPFESLVTKYKNLFAITKAKVSRNQISTKKTVKIEQNKCDDSFVNDSYIDSLEDLMHTDDWRGFEEEELENSFKDYAEGKINRK